MVGVLNDFLGQDTRGSLVPRPLTLRGCGINSSSKRPSRTFRFPMKANIILLFVVAILFGEKVLAQDRPIRIGFPSVAFQELPLFAASKRGFFRAEGLNVELVQIAGSPAVAALLSGDVDYITHNSRIIATAVRGGGVKSVFNYVAKPISLAPRSGKQKKFRGIRLGFQPLAEQLTILRNKYWNFMASTFPRMLLFARSDRIP
jgi:ABC-type nitrate/sulfonate/bicarbonate transport system substrate-binding protein